MNRLLRVTAAVVLAVIAGAAPAAAASVPYTDPSATGSVGLCDAHGQPVTTGNVHDRPFVWRAVSSVKAPDGFAGDGRKATLLAYQPRPNTPADQWNGDIMTAASTYTNPTYPMAQATEKDFTLEEFIQEFKPMVNGMLQLRIYVGAPGRGTFNTTYAATDIKVTGDTWQVVRGASVPCTNGNATSGETVLGGTAATGTSAKPTASSPSAERPAAPGSGTARAKASSTSPSTGGSTQAASDRPAAKAGPASSLSGWLLPVAAVLLAAAAAVAVWFRRRAAG